MNHQQRLFFFTFVLMPLAGIILFCVGCSTDSFDTTTLFGSSSQVSAKNHKKRGQHYLKLSQASSENASLNLEYRLRSAEAFIQAKENVEAGQILKNIQTQDPNLDLETRNTLIQARLALIKNEQERALSLLTPYLSTVANQNAVLKEHKNEEALSSSHASDKNAFQSKKIALLLPSKGPHANAAKTIRDGFLAGFYKTAGQKPNKTGDPSVQVYDTADGSEVVEAYQKALKDKVEIVVGPLTKSEVDTLASINLSTPVLALNTLSHQSKPPKQLYQFGLLPEDEVEVLARKAYQQGHHRAIIFAPKNEWGERMVSAFKSSWKGKIVELVWLSSEQDLTEKVRKTLEQDQSGRKILRKLQKNGNKKITGNQKESEHAPRNDIDMIFLAANPELARQIKPLLSYYGDPNLPVFASASVYTGIPAPGKDQDLEGIRFCDMPWVLNANENIRDTREKVATLWPASYSRSPRYFALGMDAYKLANQISDSTLFNPSSTKGVTGDLHIDQQHRIQRSLTCAKFVQGVPVAD